MKVLIDIPKESYDFAKECKHNGTSKYDWGLTYNNTVFMIANGTPIPDNATNGDVIKAMFPGYHAQINTALESVNLYYEDTEEYAGSWIRFDLNWWNASYKRGNENGKN